MLNNLLNTILQFFLVVILLIFLSASVKIIYLNIKHFDVIKSGTILNVDYGRGSKSSHSKGTYLNTILIDNSKETVYGGSQNQYNIGDSIKIRYRGFGGNIIFKVNGLRVRSKYDTWDWLSPIIFLFTSFMLFKITTVWLIPFIQKIKK